MKKIIKSLVYSLLIAVTLSACSTRLDEPKNNFFQKIQLKYAKSFSVLENSTEYKIEFIDQDNQTVVSSMIFPKTSKEVSRAAIFSSSVVGYLAELNCLNKVVGVEKLNSIYNATLNQKAKKNQLKEYLDYSLVNPERVKKDGVNLIFYSLFAPEISPMDAKLKKLGITSVPILEWKEQHPLGKAEWLKVYGIVFNCYDLALSKFNQIEEAYLKTKKELQAAQKTAPSVLVGSMFQDIWYLPGGNSYLAKIMSDANGNYVLKADKTTGSCSFTFEQIYQKYASSLKWVNLNSSSKKELLSQFEGYKHFAAFQSGQMYSYQNNFLKYFEESPVKPHLLLIDLHKIFTEENPEGLYFYAVVK